jgi:hypothetical protein
MSNRKNRNGRARGSLPIAALPAQRFLSSELTSCCLPERDDSSWRGRQTTYGKAARSHMARPPGSSRQNRQTAPLKGRQITHDKIARSHMARRQIAHGKYPTLIVRQSACPIVRRIVCWESAAASSRGAADAFHHPRLCQGKVNS